MTQPTETNSLEVRWFGEGAPPTALREWLTDLGSVDAGTRTDLYLAPTDPSLNLKLRDEGDGAVEVKRRLAGPVSRTFADGVAGCVEQWYKWSFSLDDRPVLRSADPTGLWLPVEKSRLRYALDGEDSPLADRSPDLTAHVEVTEVTTPARHAWTVGAEVAGPAAELEPTLTAVVTELFGDAVPAHLAEAASLGYAAWLARDGSETGPDPDVLVLSER